MGWTSHGGPVFYLRPAKINSAGLRRLRGGVLCTLVIGSASAQKQIHILDCQARLKRQVDPVPDDLDQVGHPLIDVSGRDHQPVARPGQGLRVQPLLPGLR